METMRLKQDIITETVRDWILQGKYAPGNTISTRYEKRDLEVNLTEYDNMPADGKLVPWKFTRQAGTLQNRILKVNNANPWEVFVWEVK